MHHQSLNSCLSASKHTLTLTYVYSCTITHTHIHRKRSLRFRSDLKRVPKRSLALIGATWAIFVLLQVTRFVMHQ
jgi:hypothetical protein